MQEVRRPGEGQELAASSSWASATASTRTSTRARSIIKAAADKVLAQARHQRSAARHRQALEEAALKDDYFVERKLYPNVDFYSGIIYRAIGFPTNMFTVMFALGRLPGWIAHWKEMIEDADDEDRPPAPDLHRRDRAQLRAAGRARVGCLLRGPRAAPPGRRRLPLSLHEVPRWRRTHVAPRPRSRRTTSSRDRCTCGILHVTLLANGVTVRMTAEQLRASQIGFATALEKIDEPVEFSSTGSTSIN